MSVDDAGPDAGAAETPGPGRRVRVAIPVQLRTLAGIEPEVTVVLDPAPGAAPTTRELLDVLEDVHPGLRGTIRERRSGARRAYMRFFVGTRDWSHESPDAPLPQTVLSGQEPFRIVGAIAGG